MTHAERFFVTSNGHTYFSPSTIGTPAIIHHVNREEFKQSAAEKEVIKGFKKLVGKSKNHKFKTLTKVTI